VYEVVDGEGSSFPASATVDLPSFDNGIFDVTVGPHGEITSVIDHNDGDRELVGDSGSIHDLGSGSGTAVVENSGPVSTTLLVEAGGYPEHETRVTLYAGIDRIDIEGRVTQNFSSNQGYLSEFNFTSPQIRHEEVGMIALVARVENGGDYADENTRTDYLTFNHFVDLSETDRGLTMSNRDCQFFKAGNSTVNSLDGTTPSVRAVVGMQVDGYGLGIPNQGDDTLFVNRFAIRTHDGYDQASAMRFALEHQNPLTAGIVTGDLVAPLPPDTLSMLSISSDDVLLWALKPSEEGIEQGIIVRVWNLAEGQRQFDLSIHAFGIDEAIRATHIETDIEEVTLVGDTLRDDLATQEMRTYRLYPSSKFPRSVLP
jgi:alpha-mannosidase